MAGIGKYKKGAKFTLKSGNTTSFKSMGSSPGKHTVVKETIIRPAPDHKNPHVDKKGNEVYTPPNPDESPANMNNFGIGPGASPWKEGEEEVTVDPNATTDPNATKEEVEKEEDKVDETGGDAEKADKAWVKALKAGTTLLSGGIQGVYGGTREYPKINYGKKAKEPTTTPEQRVEAALSEGDAGSYEEYMAKNPDSEYSKEEWTKLNLQNVIGGTEKNENDDE